MQKLCWKKTGWRFAVKYVGEKIVSWIEQPFVALVVFHSET